MRVCCNFFLTDWKRCEVLIAKRKQYLLMCSTMYTLWFWYAFDMDYSFCFLFRFRLNFKYLAWCCWTGTPCCFWLILCTPLFSHSMTFYMKELMSCTRTLLLLVSGWISRHVIGAVLVSLPAICVLSHLTCSIHLPLQVILSIGWKSIANGDCDIFITAKKPFLRK